MREVSATDRLTKRTALTGAATSIAEIFPMTSNAETRSTDSHADERREVCVTKKGGPAAALFVFARQTPTQRIAGDNEERAPLRTGDRWFDAQIKVSQEEMDATA